MPSCCVCPVVHGLKTSDPVFLLAALLGKRVKLRRLIAASKRSWMSLANWLQLVKCLCKKRVSLKTLWVCDDLLTLATWQTTSAVGICEVHMWPCDAHYVFSWLQSSCLQIKERTDELQSMLGWIEVNWRAQTEQLEGDQNVKREETDDAVQQEVTVWLMLLTIAN